VKIGDLGLAREHQKDDKPITATVVTFYYRPPELFQQVQEESLGSTWNHVQPSEKGSSSSKGFKFVGARVRVRDSETEQWRKGEVTEVMSDGRVKVKVDNTLRAFTWTHVEAEDGAPAKDEKPKEEKYSMGDRVQVRDSVKEQWRTGTVVDMRNGTPVVKCDGQSRGFTWGHVQSLDKEEKKEEKKGEFSVGDRVKVRDGDTQPWQHGEVTDLRGSKPVVKIDGQSRGFTWAYVEHDKKEAAAAAASTKYSVGDRVKMKDQESEQWKHGIVAEVLSDGQVKIKHEGGNRAFKWAFVEPVVDSSTPAFYVKGERVKVRDRGNEDWREGEVTDEGQKPKVRVDSATRSFQWNHVERLMKKGDRVKVKDTGTAQWRKGQITGYSAGKPLVTVDGQNQGFHFSYVEPDTGTPPQTAATGPFKVGEKVRMRDSDKDAWRNGEVTGFAGNQPQVRQEGLTRSFTYKFVERASTSTATLKVGDMVRMRDGATEKWRKGKITEMRGGQPAVQEEGHARAFTWSFVEPLEGTFRVGDKVKVRDSDKEAWKNGEVTSITNGKAQVKAEGSSRAFSWKYVEKRDAAAAPAAGSVFRKGDRVRVRDSTREDWKHGEVTEEASGGVSAKAKVDGNSRAFTWSFMEHASPVGGDGGDKFKVGDRVQVRDGSGEKWKQGEVTEVDGGKPRVRVDGQTRSFKWNQVEHWKGQEKKGFEKGDRVRVRDSERENWRFGEVTEVDSSGKPRVRADQSHRAFTWNMVEHAPSSELPSAVSGKGGGTSDFKIDDRVRVRDRESEKWQEGVVMGFDGNKPKVSLKGSASRPFTWNFVEKISGSSSSPRGFREGERVRVRDSEREDWKSGTVQGFGAQDKPLVVVDGQKRAFLWGFTERA